MFPCSPGGLKDPLGFLLCGAAAYGPGFHPRDCFIDAIRPESDASLGHMNGRDFFIPNPSIDCSHRHLASLRKVALG
jgi:hypothetical protein